MSSLATFLYPRLFSILPKLRDFDDLPTSLSISFKLNAHMGVKYMPTAGNLLKVFSYCLLPPRATDIQSSTLFSPASVKKYIGQLRSTKSFPIFANEFPH